MKNSTIKQQQSVCNSIEDKSVKGNAFDTLQELPLELLGHVYGGSCADPAGPNEPGSGDRDIGGARPDDSECKRQSGGK